MPRVLKSERRRQESQSQRRRCDNVIREYGVLQSEKNSTNHYCLEDEGRGPEIKELGWPLEGGESKETDSPQSLQKEYSFADTLILAK